MNRKKRVNPSVIKDALDNLPYGVAFVHANGVVRLCNRAMHRLSQMLLGYELQNGELFWNEVIASADRKIDDGYLLRFPEKAFWMLRRTECTLEGHTIWQITAQDMTQLYTLNDQLEADNLVLASIAGRLRRYSRSVEELTRSRELLERKDHTHTELGQLLTATSHYLNGGDISGEELWNRWHINAKLMTEESAGFDSEDLTEQLRCTARAVGVTVVFHGETPAGGVPAEILLAAGGVCLTNLLNHARGNLLTLDCSRSDSRIVMSFSNNGIPPQGTIVEGGGLSSLRQKVENAGGTMVIRSAPSFQLTITLPEEGEPLHE